jgi:hypothetical protein
MHYKQKKSKHLKKCHEVCQVSEGLRLAIWLTSLNCSKAKNGEVDHLPKFKEIVIEVHSSVH